MQPTLICRECSDYRLGRCERQGEKASRVGGFAMMPEDECRFEVTEPVEAEVPVLDVVVKPVVSAKPKAKVKAKAGGKLRAAFGSSKRK